MPDALVTFLFLVAPAFAQPAATFPPWLEGYAGTTPVVRSSPLLVEASYTASATPEEIIEHYRKQFGTAGLDFHPNSDGLGTSIRGGTPACDLLIQIRTREEGAFVNVTCAAKTADSTASPPSDVRVITSRPQSSGIPVRPGARPASIRMDATQMMQQHQQKVAEMGIHRQYKDAAAPPLVWPSWLLHINGSPLHPEHTKNQAKKEMLKARYVTSAPMTELAKFYRELLDSHEYPARASLETGHTISGIQQNAHGSVEGSNYPDGAPGAHSVIDVTYDRSVLNGPITVTLRFTTFEYIAKRGY